MPRCKPTTCRWFWPCATWASRPLSSPSLCPTVTARPDSWASPISRSLPTSRSLGPGDVDALAADNAATAVAIKPPKLGGLGVALATLDQARDTGLAASLGGMLECGLGRHLLAAVAPSPIFTVIGDLSPARRWLADDPFPDIAMIDGRIQAPATVGIAGEPDADKLAHYTVRSAVVALPQGSPSL